MPADSPRWVIPVLVLPDYRSAALVVYAADGNVFQMPPAGEAVYIVPPPSDEKLAEAILLARAAAEKQGRRGSC